MRWHTLLHGRRLIIRLPDSKAAKHGETMQNDIFPSGLVKFDARGAWLSYLPGSTQALLYSGIIVSNIYISTFPTLTYHYVPCLEILHQWTCFTGHHIYIKQFRLVPSLSTLGWAVPERGGAVSWLQILRVSQTMVHDEVSCYIMLPKSHNYSPRFATKTAPKGCRRSRQKISRKRTPLSIKRALQKLPSNPARVVEQAQVAPRYVRPNLIPKKSQFGWARI
jgi:hypothetical protein